jgi:lambda family phage portal protein
MASVINRSGGGSLGTMSNWSPRRLSWPEEGRQREAIVNRANDIAANNAHGASLVDSISINTVGSGLWPQSKPNYKRLGITEEQAQEVAEQMEWEFEQFCKTADASAPSASTATSNFYGMQFQNVYSMLVNGEFINLPLMINSPDRRYSLALQSIDPIRLRTPMALIGEKGVRDGIRLGNFGQPTGYFIADPEDGRFTTSLDLRYFREISPLSGHRANIFHRYYKKLPEQVRGVSTFAPSMKLFRDMNDYLDFELVGAIMAASFPVWIEKQQGFDANTMAANPYNQDPLDLTRYQEIPAGQIMYGNTGEKPHVMGHNRPGGSFQVFVETMLRAIGASTGMPYEVIAKDFSKTNYSSARAALEEAWRVFGLYQDWMISYFCQVVWEMVFEEAFLRGYVKLPKGSPDFYTAKAEWTAATWIVPEKTQLDPVKEMTASIMGLNSNIFTAADIAGKRGKDWEAQYEQRSRENRKADELDLPRTVDALKPKVDKTSPDQPTDDNTDEAVPGQKQNGAFVDEVIAAAIVDTFKDSEKNV